MNGLLLFIVHRSEFIVRKEKMKEENLNRIPELKARLTAVRSYL
jgi:hypothetical protein